MVHKQKVRTIFENSFVGDSEISEGSLPVAANSLPMSHFLVPLQKTRFKLDGAVLSILAANDYGSLQLCDLPNSNLVIAGALVDASYVVSGFATDQGDSIDWALGTVAITSTDFSNNGEADIVDEFDGTGGTSTGAAAASSVANSSPAQVFVAAGASNDIFLNAQGAVTTGTGTITFAAGSYVDLFYHDLGAA